MARSRLRRRLAAGARPLLCVAAGLLGGVALGQVRSGAPGDGVTTTEAGASVYVAPPEHGVWYEVFVRSFKDSDGDGIGDLRGLASRLPYLAELGVTGIWLMPIHPSASYHGYDVTDYYAVNPDYGTLDDLRYLLDEAHALGMRVIIDLVPNHTSSEHPWFKAALAGDPTYRDYYVWSDDPPDWRGTRGGSAWHEAAGSHYLGLFSPAMPDLNLRNAEVTRAVLDVMTFWLDFGVDGFRVDAIQHLVESEDGVIANSEANYRMVELLQAHAREVAPGAVFVGETWTEMPAIVRYHRQSGLHMSFDYPLWRELLGGVQRRSASDLAFTLTQEESLYPQDALRATFTSNHDQTRFATQLSLPRRDERRIELAASLLLTLPGTPFIYYGEEVGMVDGPGSSDVEKRTPMPWEPGAGSGFTTGVPWTDPGPGVPGVTVTEQMLDPDSVWWHYRRMITLRRMHPALYRGETLVLETESSAVLALVREATDEVLAVVANLGARDQTLGPDVLPFTQAIDVLTGRPFDGRVPGLTLLVLRPD